MDPHFQSMDPACPSISNINQSWLVIPLSTILYLFVVTTYLCWALDFFSKHPRAAMVVPTGEPDAQVASPLFSRLPPEIRDEIYVFALHSYDDRSRRYKPTAPYYRPGYRCAQKIDTDLLLTCRRVYQEARILPARINELAAWYHRGPPEFVDNLTLDEGLASSIRWRELRTVHIFAQQFWLEDYRHGFGLFTNLWESACPTSLIITIRHTDWYWWEYQAPLALDPKRAGQPSAESYSRPSDGFEWGSWGSQFRKIRGLKTLKLELETVENKMRELDAIVKRAKHWEFPMEDERVLILNESKTKRTGWNGENVGMLKRANSSQDLQLI